MEVRHFANKAPAFPDPTSSTPISVSFGKQLQSEEPELREQIAERVARLFRNIVRDKPPSAAPREATVYTGQAGLGLLFLRASESKVPIPGFSSEQLLHAAADYLDGCMAVATDRNHVNEPSTFMMGAAGIYALSIVLCARLGRTAEIERYMKELEMLAVRCEFDPNAASRVEDISDELVFGRAGYLYALTYIYAHQAELPVTIPRSIFAAMRRVFFAILASGEALAQVNSGRVPVGIPPLLWLFHGKAYYGAGHGAAGILLTLLNALQVTNEFDRSVSERSMTLIWNMVDWLRAQRLPRGNFAASLGNPEDRLVQWCHGAPGVVLMLAKCAELRQEGRAALEAEMMLSAACIWERGLLIKGNGLCHGTAGNAYAFLALYRETGLEQFRLAALAFAKHTMDDRFVADIRPADHPHSLFEGAAGTALFLLDVLEPARARFPGAEV